MVWHLKQSICTSHAILMPEIIIFLKLVELKIETTYKKYKFYSNKPG